MKAQPLTIYLPDTRGVQISRFGKGNAKIGAAVHTYSRLPGLPRKQALGAGYADEFVAVVLDRYQGTCPGATDECQAICYAARPVAERGPVAKIWHLNSISEDVPLELPPDCTLLRIHVSGDFTSTQYINNWRRVLEAHPQVTAWAYTRSWRVPSLLPALEALRALPNVQLFASMDSSTLELPPEGWRRAWIDRDLRLSQTPFDGDADGSSRNQLVWASAEDRWTDPIGRSYVCPEETGHKRNCEECGYCFEGKQHDVTFLKH